MLNNNYFGLVGSAICLLFVVGLFFPFSPERIKVVAQAPVTKSVTVEVGSVTKSVTVEVGSVTKSVTVEVGSVTKSVTVYVNPSTPPTINSVTATPKLIRSGQTSIITAVVTASEDSTCKFTGAELTPVYKDYPAGSVLVSKSVTTRSLVSAQIVEVECYPDSDPPNKVIATPVRVNIVPIVQEI